MVAGRAAGVAACAETAVTTAGGLREVFLVADAVQFEALFVSETLMVLVAAVGVALEGGGIFTVAGVWTLMGDMAGF